MALNWDVSRVADYKTVTTSPDTRDKEEEEQKWHPVTNAIVMASMVAGFREITEQNYKKIALRMAQYQQACGELLGYALMPKVWITEEDVRMHIGLCMNVTPKTDAQFAKTLMRIITDECKYKLGGHANRNRLPPEFTREDDEGTAMSAYEIVQRAVDHYSKEKTHA